MFQKSQEIFPTVSLLYSTFLFLPVPCRTLHRKPLGNTSELMGTGAYLGIFSENFPICCQACCVVMEYLISPFGNPVS